MGVSIPSPCWPLHQCLQVRERVRREIKIKRDEMGIWEHTQAGCCDLARCWWSLWYRNRWSKSSTMSHKWKGNNISWTYFVQTTWFHMYTKCTWVYVCNCRAKSAHLTGRPPPKCIAWTPNFIVEAKKHKRLLCWTLINVCWKSKGSDEATWISFGSKAQKSKLIYPTSFNTT
jgi:hypothetical protein